MFHFAENKLNIKELSSINFFFFQRIIYKKIQ